MDNLSSFLKKFQKIIGDKSEEKNTIKEALKIFCNFDIDIKDIKIKDGNVMLSTSPVFRSEIFLKKQKIISYLKTKGFVFRDFQ
jgi:hypothetical protein